MIIKNWDDLAKLPESEDYRLHLCFQNNETEEYYYGYILNKKKNNRVEYYLSTSTFDSEDYEYAMKLLKSYGFDVTLKSDKKIKRIV